MSLGLCDPVAFFTARRREARKDDQDGDPHEDRGLREQEAERKQEFSSEWSGAGHEPFSAL